MSLVLIGRLSLWPKLTKINNTKFDRDFAEATPNPQSSKMVVKLRTNRKRQMCYCAILHEVNFFIIVALGNNGQLEIRIQTLNITFRLQSPCIQIYCRRNYIYAYKVNIYGR